MKGKAIIELCDKNGKKVQEEHNIVTDIFRNITDGALRISTNPVLGLLALPFKKFVGKDMFGGIQIFSEHHELNNKIIHRTQNPLSVAGGNYSNTDSDRGNLNTIESMPITKGYRWVWDFSTSQSNGSIKSLSMCTLSRGNKILDGGAYRLGTPVSQSTLNIHNNYNYSLEVKPYNNGVIEVIDDKIIFKTLSSINPSLGIEDNLTSIELFANSDYTELTKMRTNILIDDILTFMAKKESSNSLVLIRFNLITKTIDKEILIDTHFANDKIFGITGKKLFYGFIVNKSTSYSVKCKVYDFDTKTIVNPELLIYSCSLSTTQVLELNAIYVNTFVQNNECVCEFIHGGCYNNSTSSTIIRKLLCRCVLLENLNLLPVFFVVQGNTKVRYDIPILYPYNDSVVALYNTGEGCSFAYAPEYFLGVDNSVLLTINNLETPIEKTEDNTMKITYEITWA